MCYIKHELIHTHKDGVKDVQCAKIDTPRFCPPFYSLVVDGGCPLEGDHNPYEASKCNQSYVLIYMFPCIHICMIVYMHKKPWTNGEVEHCSTKSDAVPASFCANFGASRPKGFGLSISWNLSQHSREIEWDWITKKLLNVIGIFKIFVESFASPKPNYLLGWIDIATYCYYPAAFINIASPRSSVCQCSIFATTSNLEDKRNNSPNTCWEMG